MWSWGLGDGGFQMREEEGDILNDKMGESSRSSSMSAGENLASSSYQRAGGSSRESLSSDIVMSKPVFHPASSTSEDEWSCSYPNCGRTFTRRHKLNRHQKYHSKLHRCLEATCRARDVAFSLEKDLVRHQAQHNGRRFYCHYDECSHSVNGAQGGFTRRDNLKRHITNQHRQARP
ncbi:hypothetical protein BDZ45DRAFT_476037 [Acephala macrosclerotiorum]|nr:hypothetical protein BDZ45DRAFT_476037 [Acephala macrosclerotiorum]